MIMFGSGLSRLGKNNEFQLIFEQLLICQPNILIN